MHMKCCALPYVSLIVSMSWPSVIFLFVGNVIAETQKCVKWGNTFDVSLESNNVLRPCNLADGRPICCAAVYTNQSESRGVGVEFVSDLVSTKSRQKEYSRVSCTVTKKYVSSPLELRDLAFSVMLEKTIGADNVDKRVEELLGYVTSAQSISNSSKWLERVRLHMLSETTPNLSEDDFEFLSRFEHSRVCGNEVEEWIEWIEPITVTARHPFGFGKCKNTAKYFKKGMPRAGRSDVDYILLQSGLSLFNQTHTLTGRRIVNTDGLSSGGPRGSGRAKRSPKHFMLDAGTSTFDSSLFWFTCGYAQVSYYSPSLGLPS